MTEKQYKLLKLLDKQIQNCQLCDLYKNGRTKPFWTNQAKYMMILESPGKQEVLNNEVLIGKTGKLFWLLIEEAGLNKNDFLIMNSVNCRVMNGNKQGKPSNYHLTTCNAWLRKYIKVLRPEKIILFGNYAIRTILDEWGISKYNGIKSKKCLYGTIDSEVLRCYHPSACLYNPVTEIELQETLDNF